MNGAEPMGKGFFSPTLRPESSGNFLRPYYFYYYAN
jgi:hypothetical protein